MKFIGWFFAPIKKDILGDELSPFNCIMIAAAGIAALLCALELL